MPECESYLIHTSISKEQRGVIQGDCRRRVHIGMLVFLEEVNKPLPDLASCERGFHLEAPSHSCPKQAEEKAARPWRSLKKQQQTAFLHGVSSSNNTSIIASIS